AAPGARRSGPAEWFAAETDTMTASRAVRKKATALVLSGILPGLGQLYNREFLKAALFLVAGTGLGWVVARAVDPVALIERGASPSVILGMLALLAICLWSVVDAWRSAG